MNKITAVGLGIAATVGVIVLQWVLPFAFDFVSTVGIYALGVVVGREMMKP
jgi:hypothetical protein